MQAKTTLELESDDLPTVPALVLLLLDGSARATVWADSLQVAKAPDA